MKENIELLILVAVERSNTIIPLFEVGYSYSNVIKWTRALELDGKIIIDSDKGRVLTEKGLKRLKELKHGRKEMVISPLKIYRRKKMNLDEVYLP